MSNPGYLAAIDTTGLYVAEATGIKHYGEMHEEPRYSLQFLLAVAEAYHVSQLWVHASLEPHLPDFTAPAWDIRPEPVRLHMKRWYHCFRPGVHGDGIDLYFPAHDENCSWMDCESAAELLADVVTFNAALGLPFQKSPGSTGIALMRDVHPRAGLIRTQMDTQHAPPPPAVLPAYGSPAQDCKWMRGLDEAEQCLTYGHVYDKNNAYLAAAASLELGLGAWELWSFDDIDHAHGFESGKVLPGYYHVVEAHCRADWGLPSPLDVSGVFASRKQTDYWVMAPSLDVALRAGYFVDVSEAYVYPKHTRALAQWEARLREAGVLIAHNAVCQRVRKELYTQSIQWLGLKPDEGQRNSLYHPDWRHAIISMTAANIWRNAQNAVKLGAHIPAIYMKDTMLVLTDNPLPAEHAEQIGLKLGKGPGQWKIRQASIPMEELRPAFDAFAGPGGAQMGLSILRGITESRRKREAVHA